MKRLAVLIILFMAAGHLVSSDAGPEKSVVEVLVTYQEFDPLLPWRKNQPDTREGYGAVVGGGRILTTESLVRNHTLVEIRLPETGRKFPADVMISDWQADLAVLRPRVPDSLGGMDALDIADTVPRDDGLRVFQFDDTGRVRGSPAQVIEVSVKPLPSPAARSLMFTLHSDLEVKANGAVVVHGGKLAGIVSRYQGGDRSADALPVPVLRRFLEDADDPPYRGFGFAGFSWSPLIDPAKRAYLGADKLQGGILVLSCVPGSGAADVLADNDVIVAWDGFAIDERGYYEDPDFGTLSIPYLISGRRRPGEEVPVKVVREGEVQELRVPLTPYLDSGLLVPENVTGAQAEYLVEGGLVLRELSGNYLRAYGSQWMSRANPRLAHIYLTRRMAPDRAGDRIVILSRVIPEQVNIGYQHLYDLPVKAVNEEPVRNMADVFRIADRDGHVTRLSLQSIEVDLVIPSGPELEEANLRVARSYRIPALRHAKNDAIKEAP